MESEASSQAFSVIAPYYDKLMSFVNYPDWVSYIETILSLNNTKDRLIFDLACGTGICLKLWQQKGYRVIGLDRSLSMLRVCQEKMSPGYEYLLINGDMRNFALAKKIQIITCLYDSLNYLLNETDISDCFAKVYAALSDHGLFIFDLNTIHALRDEWGNQTFYRRDQEISSIWINTFDPQTNVSTLRITLDVHQDGKHLELKEFHQERAFSLDTIKNLLSQAGLKGSFYRHLTFTMAQESDLRVMGVARK